MEKKRLVLGVLLMVLSMFSPVVLADTGVTVEQGTTIHTSLTYLTTMGEYTFGRITINTTHIIFNSSEPAYLTGIAYAWDSATSAIVATGTDSHTSNMYFSETPVYSTFRITSVQDGYISAVPSYDDTNGRFTMIGYGDITLDSSAGFPSMVFSVTDDGVPYNDWNYTGSGTQININNIPSNSIIILDFELDGEDDDGGGGGVPVDNNPVNDTTPEPEVPNENNLPAIPELPTIPGIDRTLLWLGIAWLIIFVLLASIYENVQKKKGRWGRPLKW